MDTLKVPVTQEDHIQGDFNAPITLVEYGDYECPNCGAAYPIVKQIQEHFGKQLRFVFRNFPLTEVHPHAELAAETAEFSDTKGHFWEMHDLLFENQASLSISLLYELVESLKIPPQELKQALENQIFEPKVRKDFLGGVRSGVNGTPTFFINGQRQNAGYSFEELLSAIEAVVP